MWDQYFYNLCKAVALKSPCLSRKIGAIIVRDNSILSTGYNGPPRGIPHCGHARFQSDNYLNSRFEKVSFKPEDIGNTCPRKILNWPSGGGMHLCTAQHAEENAVSNAARHGTNINDTTLYMNCVIPCHKCLGTLINAGITKIVVDSISNYDDQADFIVKNSNLIIRRFK